MKIKRQSVNQYDNWILVRKLLTERFCFTPRVTSHNIALYTIVLYNRFASPPNQRHMPYQQQPMQPMQHQFAMQPSDMRMRMQLIEQKQYEIRQQQMLQRQRIMAQQRHNMQQQHHPMALVQRPRAGFLPQNNIMYNEMNINQQQVRNINMNNMNNMSKMLMRQQRPQVTQFRNRAPLIAQPVRQQVNSQIAINNQQAGFRPSLSNIMQNKNANIIAARPGIGAVDFSCNLGNGQSRVNRNQFDLPQQPLAGKRYVAEQHVSQTKHEYSNGQQQQPNTLLKKPPLLADPPLQREQSKSPSGAASQSSSHQSLDRRKSNVSDNFKTKSQLETTSTIVVSTAVSDHKEGNNMADEGERTEENRESSQIQPLQIDYDHGHNSQSDR